MDRYYSENLQLKNFKYNMIYTDWLFMHTNPTLDIDTIRVIRRYLYEIGRIRRILPPKVDDLKDAYSLFFTDDYGIVFFHEPTYPNNITSYRCVNMIFNQCKLSCIFYEYECEHIHQGRGCFYVSFEKSEINPEDIVFDRIPNNTSLYLEERFDNPNFMVKYNYQM